MIHRLTGHFKFREPKGVSVQSVEAERWAATSVYYSRFTEHVSSNRSAIRINLKLAAERRTTARLATQRAKTDFG